MATRNRIVVGIDPGLSGAIAAIWEDGDFCSVAPMPVMVGARREVDPRGLADWLYALEANSGGPALVAIEKVNAMPKQGIASAFTFGKGYGELLGVLAALKVPVELVTPQRWKAAVLFGTGKGKGAAIAFVRRRWPMAPLVPARCRVPHDGIADALCLAEFGRRSLVGSGSGSRKPVRRVIGA